MLARSRNGLGISGGISVAPEQREQLVLVFSEVKQLGTAMQLGQIK